MGSAPNYMGLFLRFRSSGPGIKYKCHYLVCEIRNSNWPGNSMEYSRYCFLLTSDSIIRRSSLVLVHGNAQNSILKTASYEVQIILRP